MNNQDAPLTTAIVRTEREIALMQEYRTRLVADVVTGKLDVRAAAAKLPEVSAIDRGSIEGEEAEVVGDEGVEEESA